MSNKNNRNSLSDRLNNPDRMSRAINVLLTSPTEDSINNTKDNIIVNDKVLDNNKIEDTTNTLVETVSKTLDINNNNMIINNKIEPLEKPLIKPLINNKEIILEKDIDNTNEEVKTKSNTNTKTKESSKSLAEIISEKIKFIEKLQMEELSPISLSKKKEKIKFDDRNPIISFPARPELEEIINLIYEKTGEKKYKIFEILLMNGLRNTEF